MQLFVTQHGIGRRSVDDPDILEIVEPGADDLLPALLEGWFDDLATRPVVQRLPLVDAILRPPIARPGRFVIAGLNYRSHCEETGKPIPERLVFAFAPGDAAQAAGSPIVLPSEAPSQVAYEGELAVVIGRRADAVAAADAWDVVAGVSPLNDVSAKDIQAGWTLEALARAKGFATFKPFGPCLATMDEFADPLDIGLRTWVNGELRQEGRTRDMVFPIADIIEIVSADVPLEPGDVICTGTPGGVPHDGGFPFLQPGDDVRVEVEGLPPLSNVVVGAG